MKLSRNKTERHPEESHALSFWSKETTLSMPSPAEADINSMLKEILLKSL